MFGRKKQVISPVSYDPAEKQPVIRCSICNGEQVGGLKDRRTGALEEIMMIRTDADRARFEEIVGTKDIVKEY